MLIKLIFILLFTLCKGSDTSKFKYNEKSDYEDFASSNSKKDKTNEKFNSEDYMSSFVKTINLLGKGAALFSKINPQTLVISAIGSAIVGTALYKAKEYYTEKNDEEFSQNWNKQRNEYTNDQIEVIRDRIIKYIDKLDIEKMDKSIYDEEIEEFNSILENEKKKAVNDYIIEYISNKFIEENIKNITRINILVLGKTKIGKTTLINEILFLDEKHKGKVGDDAKSTTMNDTPYTSDILKHILLIDSRGIEIGGFNLDKWLEKYKKKMDENTKYGNFNGLIHCIWYCVSGNEMNNEEIEMLNKINLLFNNTFKIPIIFVYLKPFIDEDIIKLKKATSDINNNFIPVQSKNYINKCKEDDKFCFHEPQRYNKKNMDILLNMTKDLALDGIINSVTSRTIYYLKEKLEELIDKRFYEEFYEFIEIIGKIENNFDNLESLNNIIRKIDEKREENILKIIRIIEYSLFGSKNKTSLNIKNSISSIQKKIEKKYIEKITNIYYSILDSENIKMKERKESSHKEYMKETWFGCNDLKDTDSDLDFRIFKKEIDSKYFVGIYSMIKSFETINKMLKKDILKKLKSQFEVIFADEDLSTKLKEKIRIESEKWTKDLLDSLEKEIKSAFNNNKK